MIELTGMLFVAGLVSASLPSVSSSGQPYDEAVCFKGQGAERLEACSRLIASKDADEHTRGLAYASRCMEHVHLRKLEIARKDCDAAQRIAPDATQTQFALYAVNFYGGAPRDAEIYLAKYRALVDAERERQAEKEKLRQEDAVLRGQVAALRDQCVTKTISRHPEKVISSCDALWDLSKIDWKDRALAAAISCYYRSRLRDFVLAKRDCARTLESMPASAYGHFARGHLRLLGHEFEGSLADFDQALKLGGLPNEEADLLKSYRAVASLGIAELARDKAYEEHSAGDEARTKADIAVRATYELYLMEMDRRGLIPPPQLQTKRSKTLSENKTLSATHKQAANATNGGPALAQENAIEENPDTSMDSSLEARDYLELELCRAKQSRPSYERACLVRLLRRNPRNWDGIVWLANLYAESGEHELAIKQWSKLIARAPTDAPLLVARCRQRLALGKQLKAAIKDCSNAISIEPENFVALELRASVNLRLKNFDAAIADYNAALALAPDCARCFYGRGLARGEQGNSSAMDQDIAKAKRLHPTIDKVFRDPFQDVWGPVDADKDW